MAVAAFYGLLYKGFTFSALEFVFFTFETHFDIFQNICDVTKPEIPTGANPGPVVSCGPQALVLIIQRMETGFSATSRGQTQMSVYQETMAGQAAHYVGLNRGFPRHPYAAGSPGSTQNSLR